MAKISIYNQVGEVVGDFELPVAMFGLKTKNDLIRQVLLAQRANARQSIAHTKGRGEVRGGGKKPWKQKGTGRARHGSIRSPIWKGGGVTFGPTKERNFEQKVNKKMKRQALYMALSSKLRDNELMLLDDLNFKESKTKEAQSIFSVLSSKMQGYRKGKRKQDSILLITTGSDTKIFRTVRNLPFIEVSSAKSLNIEDILKNKYMLVLKDAIPVMQATYTL